MIYLLNKIQHNSTINLTITGRKKRGKTVKKKKNKQGKNTRNTKVQQINNN